MANSCSGPVRLHVLNGEKMTTADGMPEQAEPCLLIIGHGLRPAGLSLADLVRVTYAVPNGQDFEQCWPALRGDLGRVRPAAMMNSA